MTYLNGTAATSGTSLDGRTLRHLDARQKACLAANILADPDGSFHPAVNQLANMLRVSPAYVSVARQMSAAKRAAILAGYDKSSFVGLLNAPKAPSGLSDAELQKLVREVGVGRTLNAAIVVERAS